MAPYLGLLTKDGRELRAPGYQRKDMSDVRWRISPHDEKTLVVLNHDEIGWDAPQRWGEVAAFAVFADILDPEMLTSTMLLRPLQVARWDSVVVKAGDLQLLHRFTREGDNERADDDEIARLRAALNYIALFHPTLVQAARDKFKLTDSAP